MTIPVFQHMEQASCSGCEACVNVCPNLAITMKENDVGFRYPMLQKELCVSCGLCVKICPVLCNSRKKSVRRTYAGYARSEEMVQKSSSGGFFGLIASEFLKDGGVVAGAVWADGFKSVRHSCVERLEELPLIQRSKYIQSEKANVYQDVICYLKSQKKVLFSGCPCEIAAVLKIVPLAFQRNLYTLDVVCQGPSSNKAMREYVDFMEKKYKAKIQQVNLRYAIGSWIPQFVNLQFNNGTCFIDRLYDTVLGDAIRIMQRPSCYSCHFCGIGRVADLTLGDYHGADPHSSYYHESGVSIMIAHNEKGQELAHYINEKNAYLENADYEELVQKNPRMERPREPLHEYGLFVKKMADRGLVAASDAVTSKKRKVLRKLPTKLRIRVQKFFRNHG